MQLLRRWGRGDEVWGSIPAPPTRCVLKQVVQMVIAFPFGALVLPCGQNQRTRKMKYRSAEGSGRHQIIS